MLYNSRKDESMQMHRLLVVMVLVISGVCTVQAHESPQRIQLRVAQFDPLLEGEPRTQGIQLQSASASPYQLIQFYGPIDAVWVDQLAQLGVLVLGYVPDHTIIAHVPAEKQAVVQAMYAVRWIGPYRAEYKIAPQLQAIDTALQQAASEVLVLFFPDMPQQAVEAALQSAGATSAEISITPLGIIVHTQLSAASIAQLSQVAGVNWIEPYYPMYVANAEARRIMNAESVWQSHGLFGSGQIVAISDSGLSVQGALSADFSGRLVRAYAPSEMRPESPVCQAKTNWTDLNGHGTHVAGSVLGSGVHSGSNPTAHQYTTSHAGVAPEARFVFMAMNTDGAGAIQCIPPNGNYIAFGYQNGARISTNSWGGNTNGAYTLTDGVIDDYIWRNPDYLVLFAAGNAGPEADTIGSPGSAKNILSVGASENNRPTLGPADPFAGGSISDNPNQLAYFSSRGPTDDGRIKPDIVAPGTNILSVLAAEAGGLDPVSPGQPYALSSGTSMATPLTAGAAALLREWLVRQRGMPNPSAALLKALLIHGAIALPGAAIPNPTSGWGRVDLKNTLGANYAIFDDHVQGVQTGNSITYTVDIAGSSANGTLFVQQSSNAPAVDTLQLQSAPIRDASDQSIADPATFGLQVVPGYDSATPGSAIPTTSSHIRGSGPAVPERIQLPAIGEAQALVGVAADPVAQNFLQGMVGGGTFEDPAWSEIWSEIWLADGYPLRTDGSDGGIVVNGNHSIWLGGSPSDDVIYYPVSFPEQIDSALVSRLRFLAEQTNRDVGYDSFCVALADSSGNVLGSGSNRMLYCSDNLPAGTLAFDIPLNASQRSALAGQTGYLMLFNVGDGVVPHMSAFVDDVTLVIDFPNVTLNATPGAGPPGTTFLLAGQNNIPYGAVDVCVSSCSTPANRVGIVYADARGELLAYLTTRTTAVAGTYTIQTRNAAARTAITQIRIIGGQQADLQVEPAVGSAGTVFSIRGSGFLPNDAEIAVYVNDTAIGTTGSDTSGAISFRLSTSSNTPAGEYTVLARDGANRQASVVFEVTTLPVDSASMQVDPADGPPGTTFQFTGAGFAANQQVQFTLDGQSLGNTTTNGSGEFVVNLSTNPTIATGSYTLLASQGTRQASAQFSITDGGGTTPSGNGLYVTLVWTDPPAQPAANQALVNNLNLRVEGPGGPYYGNRVNGDAINNVESIRIERPTVGRYTIIVAAQRVNANFGTQPFALVATTAQNHGSNTSTARLGVNIYLPTLSR
jgi:hypothetical protein